MIRRDRQEFRKIESWAIGRLGANAEAEETSQRLVGLVGGAGTILVGIINSINVSLTDGLGWSSMLTAYSGMILVMGFITAACGYWNHPVARWIHVALFVFSGVFGALSANRGNITTAFFVVFAIVLLVEYRFDRRVVWALGSMMLVAYVASLAIGFRDDVPRPVFSAIASFFTVLTFVGLFGGVTWRNRLILRRNALDLEERIERRTRDLNQALHERNVMLQELHHRVKNNMQTIITLLGMEIDRDPGDETVRVLSSSRQRIRAMAGVHDALYRSERLDRVELPVYIRNLSDTVLQTSIAPVDLELDFAGSGPVDLSLAVSLGLVLNELVSNAFKHGFGESRAGRIRVALQVLEDRVVLEVSDNGRGLPKGFDPYGDHGVGMSVVTSIVDHRGGTLDVSSDGETQWRLELPRPGTA